MSNNHTRQQSSEDFTSVSTLEHWNFESSWELGSVRGRGGVGHPSMTFFWVFSWEIKRPLFFSHQSRIILTVGALYCCCCCTHPNMIHGTSHLHAYAIVRARSLPKTRIRFLRPQNPPDGTKHHHQKKKKKTRLQEKKKKKREMKWNEMKSENFGSPTNQ